MFQRSQKKNDGTLVDIVKMTLLAPRIGNDVSYVTRINHEIHFAWQVQYLVNHQISSQFELS